MIQILLVQRANSAVSIANKLRKKRNQGEVDFYFFPAIFKYVKIGSGLCSSSMQHYLTIFSSTEQCFSNMNVQMNHLGILLNCSTKPRAGDSAFPKTSKQH